ncbi:PSD1 and planctomycete cytochrome C domain-containing protein [Rosistilla oblonga]|uniref:PSD1 and planctomycete cytochrome C domain-containing protein n=1 Tax=Rosistilla oblonga TaxID=2527990 RepID=UPI003A96EDC6
MKHLPSIPFLLLLLCVLAGPANGTDTDRQAIKFFETSIRPLLAKHCYDCHGDAEQEGGLRLDHISFIETGGDSGPALVASEPDESLLIEAIRYDSGLEMPPDEKLADEEIELLERWVAMGAPWPKEAAAASSRDEFGFTEEDHKWWAVQPVADPAVPKTGDAWATTPIDQFIAAKLKQADLTPAAKADRYELIRRATFDLHGLPPTRQQIDDFVNDDSPQAWERLIDRLLESPRYGERWAQHWLDVVRYAESDGYRQDAFRPKASRYRDYVIHSFNDNKPYNQFVREQLAGDEIDPDNPDVLIGTAFLRHGIYEYNQRNARMHWELIVNEMTNVTGEVFLGLGIGCAQCHDHKFDPILQKDYFALQAFLASTCWPTDMPLVDRETREKHDRMQAEWEQVTASIREQIDAMLEPTYKSRTNAAVKMFPEDIQQMFAKPREERTTYEQQMVMLVERQVTRKNAEADGKKVFAKKPEELAKFNDLQAQLKAFDHLKPEPLPTGFVATDVGPEPAETILVSRTGKTNVDPAFLTLLGQPAPVIKPTETTTGRRRALADWIAQPDNPLSTRVIVNRIWQHHFGRGIVSTPNDVGMLGEPPSHPELLDWLVQRFLENGWQFKPMHRMIMTSAAYQQTARREATEHEEAVDIENRLLWRFPPTRLDAEQVRDAMLAASGELTHRDGGGSVSGNTPVRSIYVKKIRNTPDPQLGALDAPMGFESAPTRPQTTTPTQALTLVNGEWTLKRAEAMGKRLLAGKDSISATEIDQAYWAVFGRPASDAELNMALEFTQSLVEQESPTPEPTKNENDPYPGETGLRSIQNAFASVNGVSLGSGALWIQPGSRFERLQLKDLPLGSRFTIEAIATLDRIYPDASVSTLISAWNSNNKTPGWSLGVTSAKSGYQPRNLIVQLIGHDAGGAVKYEVVASNLRFPLNKPVYVAAAVNARPSGDGKSAGTVTFYMKDLSDPKAKMQTATIPHSIVGNINNKSLPVMVGGRQGNGHRWDGQVARLAIADNEVPQDRLIVNAAAEGGPVEHLLDFDFSGEDGQMPAPGTAWVTSEAALKKSEPPSKVVAAMRDFCHALFTSNEFLYLH